LSLHPFGECENLSGGVRLERGRDKSEVGCFLHHLYGAEIVKFEKKQEKFLEHIRVMLQVAQ
jgi:hypothetical protein